MGKVRTVHAATTHDEAAQRADKVIAQLRRRHAHPQVLMYCEREIMSKDLFHGVHEGTKSVFERLRNATGERGDGPALVDKCFGMSSGTPLIAINLMASDSEKSEHTGFMNLLKGVYGLWRNTTAHETRLGNDLQERDVVDAITTLSYIHWRLDSAVNTRTHGPVD